MNPRLAQRTIWSILALSLLFIGGISAGKWLKHSTNHPLDDYGVLPKWSLTDQHKQTITDASLRGHIWVADLIFTHCTSICPLLTEKMYALQQELPANDQVRLVSFSVDPRNDQPDTLAAYANAHHARSEWSFLTGPVPSIYTIVKSGFHLPLDSTGGEQHTPIIHSPRFVLVDANGHVRAYYNGSEDSARSHILSDIEMLKSEQTP